jgi:hypothetical protein
MHMQALAGGALALVIVAGMIKLHGVRHTGWATTEHLGLVLAFESVHHGVKLLLRLF